MPARRIASLLASGTEILYALGLGDQVVAISHECDYPPEVCSKIRVTKTRINDRAPSRDIDEQVRHLCSAGEALYDLDTQKLEALQIDLIVTQAQCEVCAVHFDDVIAAVQTCPGLKGTEVVALDPREFEDLFADIERVGLAAGCPEVARDYVCALKKRVDSVRAVTEPLTEGQRPRVVCVEWVDPLMVGANWLPQLVEWAGGRCDLVEPGQPSVVTPWKQIADFDPEVMVVMPCGLDLERALNEAQTLTALPGFADLSAAKQGRVYVVDANAYFTRSSPRLVDSLELLAGLLHPTRFQGLADQVGAPWAVLT